MKNVTGQGHTISEECGFELSLISSTPTTSISTGERWYHGIDNKQIVLVHHTNGTPANKSCTRIFSLQEVKERFAWEWENDPAFRLVKDWIEEHSG